jgi:hypothetical protein
MSELALASTHGVNPTPALLSDVLTRAGELNDKLTKAREDVAKVLETAADIRAKNKTKDDIIIETITRVAEMQGFDTHEVGFVLWVLHVPMGNLCDYPGFECGRFFTGKTLAEKNRKTFDAHLIYAEARDAELKERSWSLGTVELDDKAQEFDRQSALRLLWARGFAAGIYKRNFKETPVEVLIRDKLQQPNHLTIVAKFLELYNTSVPDVSNAPKPDLIQATLEHASDILISKIDEEIKGGETPFAAIAVLLLALAALMYLTRR